jgi:hypothetical protein
LREKADGGPEWKGRQGKKTMEREAEQRGGYGIEGEGE